MISPPMAATRNRAVALLLLFHLIAPIAAAAVRSPDAAAITGLVLDSESSEPLAGATVLLPEQERAAITDSDGRYTLPAVPPGPHHIAVRLMGYAPRTLHALVPREGLLEINVSLRPRPVLLPSLDVRAPIRMRGLDPGDSTRLPDRESTIEAVRNHPRLAEPDVFQALEGGDVVMNPETPSRIHVRGSAGDQLAYQIDGVPIFSPYHAAGMSSSWNPDALSRLRLTSSGTAAERPHSLAGALAAATLAPADRLRVQGGVSTTQARITLDGPIGFAGPGGSVLLSARSGFAGLLARKSEESNLRGETGDWLAKVDVPALRGRLRLLGFESKNEIDAASTTRAALPPDSVAADNTFDWRSRSLGAEWRRAFSGVGLRVLGWAALGDAEARWSAESSPVSLTSRHRDSGLLARLEHHAPNATFSAGIRLERIKSSYRVDFDSLPMATWAIESRIPVPTAFADAARKLGPRVEIGLGGSIAGTEGDRYLSPRAMIRWEASSRLALSASFERSHQFAQSLRNAESVVGTIFPVELFVGAGAGSGPGSRSPEVPVARSNQGLIAADYRPAAGVRLALQGYARASDRLLLVAPRTGEPFSVGSFVVGSGTSRGVALDVAANGARYGFVASYGYQHVRLEFGDSSYVPEHGTKHLLQGGVIVFPTSTLSVRIGGDAAWGRRTTIATGDFEWEACNLLDGGCEFGGSPHHSGEALGGARLPAYFRLDLGVRQHWHLSAWGRDVSMAFFASVTNLLNRRNVLTSARDLSTGELTAIGMRPRAPLVVGLDWNF